MQAQYRDIAEVFFGIFLQTIIIILEAIFYILQNKLVMLTVRIYVFLNYAYTCKLILLTWKL